LVDRDFVQAYFLKPTAYESFVVGDIDESMERELHPYYLE
jgi:hypothetical protein